MVVKRSYTPRNRVYPPCTSVSSKCVIPRTHGTGTPPDQFGTARSLLWTGPRRRSGSRSPFSPRAAGSVRRQRLRGADLRNRLVSVIAVGARLHRRLAGRAADGVHGWIVPGQLRLAAPPSREPPFAALCRARSRSRRLRDDRWPTHLLL